MVWPKRPVCLRTAAPAKLNVWLCVGPKRSDGYHEIRSLMVPLGLEDEIELCYKPKELVMVGPQSPPVLSDLMWRAVAWWAEHVGPIAGEVMVRADKRIPIASGLGGGSSDAAAVLRALCHLADVRPEALDPDQVAEIGSDVPFCLQGRPALVSGRGERIAAADPPPWRWACIVWPGTPVPTESAFRWLDDAGDRQMPATDPEPGWNDFWPEISKRHPELLAIHEGIRKAGAEVVGMSGSGPTMFGLFGSQDAASTAASTLKAEGWTVWTTSVKHAPPRVRMVPWEMGARTDAGHGPSRNWRRRP